MASDSRVKVTLCGVQVAASVACAPALNNRSKLAYFEPNEKDRETVILGDG